MDFFGENIWRKIKRRVNVYYFNKHMKVNMAEAEAMRERIVPYLESKKLKYIIKIRPEPESNWPKVVIDVQVDIKPFSVLMKLWEEIDAVGYSEDSVGKDVYIHVNKLE
jgi:hypothetical protein